MSALTNRFNKKAPAGGEPGGEEPYYAWNGIYRKVAGTSFPEVQEVGVEHKPKDDRKPDWAPEHASFVMGDYNVDAEGVDAGGTYMSSNGQCTAVFTEVMRKGQKALHVETSGSCAGIDATFVREDDPFAPSKAGHSKSGPHRGTPKL